MNDSLFSKSVDVILEENDSFSGIKDKAAELAAAEDRVNDLKQELQHETDRLNSDLALRIRRKEPQLTAKQTNGGALVIGYSRGKAVLTLKPITKEERFEVGSSAFDRRFKRYHGQVLDQGIDIISGAVVEFFKQNFRSLK